MDTARLPWTPSSWRSKHAAQTVAYPPELAARMEDALNKLKHLPPLVTSSEIERLRAQLADVANNKAFLLHGGDCAELFEYCNELAIEQRISLLLLSSLVIVFGGRTPCVRILRGAGQYAKPRSSPTEIVDGKEVLSFRGENVNGIGLDERVPDPDRLVQAYFHSAATINYIRALLESGFADLHNPRSWKLSHVHNKELATAFDDIVERLEDSLDFLKVVGGESGTLRKADIWTSHEGLMLDFEEALTRSYKDSNGDTHWYNTSAPFLWIGDRTRDINGAHIEYFRGIRNPIGLKCGPSLAPEELIRLLDILDPDFEPGRVTLISRYGNHKVEECLPAHIKAVQSTRHRPVFCADIMHGNTFQASSGPYKTRHMADLCSELVKSWRIHRTLDSKLQGIHLEMTGDVDENGYSVTEIVGGSMERSEEDLPTRYLTFCDPRCSVEQTIDIAFLTADYLTTERTGTKKGSTILSHLTSREPSKSRQENGTSSQKT